MAKLSGGLTVAQVRVGDVLVRRNDHLGRPDARCTVREVLKDGKRRFVLDGHWATRPVYGSELSAENIDEVERDGTIIGSFFVKYW